LTQRGFEQFETSGFVTLFDFFPGQVSAGLIDKQDAEFFVYYKKGGWDIVPPADLFQGTLVW